MTAEPPQDTVDPVKTWIIGRGGLLGRALARRFTDQWTAPAITWSDPTAALGTLRTQAKEFHEQTADQPWALLWAAGTGVVSSDAAALQAERSYLMTVLESVASRRDHGPGVVFLASSAGGVYAGSAPAPFHAGSPAIARSPYGEVKLQQESDARRLLADRAGLLIGRIANLYGPDQNPDKQQGLITRLCQAAAHRSPLNLYVPLGTLRDYIYADDAAAVIAQQVRRSLASHKRPYEQTVMVVATGQATSVGQLIGVVQGVTHRRVPLATGSQAGTRIAAQRQVPDLRLIPTVLLSERTALATGVRRVFDALVTRTRTA